MNTEYVLDKRRLESLPKDSIDISTFRNLDDLVSAVIEYANMFVVLQRNAGGYQRGEPQYHRSEHLTLEAARLAAKTRYEQDPRQRPCVIYAVMMYTNNPIGFSQIAETFPNFNNPYGTPAKLAKRKGRPASVRKSLRDIPEPGSLENNGRYFEGPGSTPQTQEEIQRALTATKIVGKGGSKIAVGYSKKRKK